MAITQAIPTSFKQELAQGLHNFDLSGGDAFKIALYTSSATLGATTTVHSATNEVAGTGYTAGGATLTNVDPATSSATAFLDFADAAWVTSTITARGAMIYNSTNGNRAVAILDFGSDKTSTASTFTVIFPTADATSAIIRIS